MRYTTLGKLIDDIDPSLIQPTETPSQRQEVAARAEFIKIMKAEGHIKWSNLENAVNDCARSIERGNAPFEYVDAIIHHVVECVQHGATHVDIGISAIAKIASAMLKQSEYGANRNDSVWITDIETLHKSLAWAFERKDTETLHKNAAWAFERMYTISVADAQPLTLSKRVRKRLLRLCRYNNAYGSMTWFMLGQYSMWRI
jgi:hypothetical protein